MGDYSELYPRHGREHVSTGPQATAADDSRIATRPQRSRPEGLGRSSEPPRPNDDGQDLRQTIHGMERAIDGLTQRFDDQPPTNGEVSSLMKKLERRQKWSGPLVWLVSGLAFVFSGGVTWAVFLGANATDDEVVTAVSRAQIEHNGGIDPDSVDPTTHKPVGHHPDMRDAIEENGKAIGENMTAIGAQGQLIRKLDKRSEYQFELTLWEQEKASAKKERRKPIKSPRLGDLERELILQK